MKPTCTLPALPREHAAVEREPRPLGLRDLERRDVVAQRGRGEHVVVAALGRDRDDAVVVDAQHLEPVEVDEHDHSVDRVRPFAVARLRLDERDAAPEPLPRLLGRPEMAGRPCVDLDRVEVGDAAAGHRRLELGMVAHELLGLHQLRDDGHRLHVRPLAPVPDGGRAERDDGLDGLLGIAVEDDHLGRPRGRCAAGCPREDDVLGRLEQGDGDEARALAERREARVGAQARRDLADLRRGQRIERVGALPGSL